MEFTGKFNQVCKQYIDVPKTGAYLCSPVPMFPEPMFPSRPTYVPRFAVNDSSTPPRLIFLSLQIDMIIYIIVIFALVVSMSVRRGRCRTAKRNISQNVRT